MKQALLSVASALLGVPRPPRRESMPGDLRPRFDEMIAATGDYRPAATDLAWQVGLLIALLVAGRALLHPWAYPVSLLGVLLLLAHLAAGTLAGGLAALGLVATTLWSTTSRCLVRLAQGIGLITIGLLIGQLAPLALAGQLFEPSTVAETNAYAEAWRPGLLAGDLAWFEALKDGGFYLLELCVVAGAGAAVIVGEARGHRRARALAFALAATAAVFTLGAATRSTALYVRPSADGWPVRLAWATTHILFMLAIAVTAVANIARRWREWR